jgi:hypothetical protein
LFIVATGQQRLVARQKSELELASQRGFAQKSPFGEL